MKILKFSGVIALMLLFSASGIFAQEDPKDLYKTAKNGLSAYELNQTENFPKLIEASEAVSKALQTDLYKSDIKVLGLAGEIYNTIASKEVLDHTLGQKESIEYPNAALNAKNYYMQAFDLAEKKRNKNRALDGLLMSAENLSNTGNILLGMNKYAEAFEPLSAVLEINDLLLANDEESVFQEDDVINNHKYVTAVTANEAEKPEIARSLLEGLYEIKYDNEGIYSALFQLLSESDPEKAEEVLTTGKELFPESKDLLFTEINHLIQTEQMDKLQVKLEEAVEADPENQTIRNALGNVYMTMFNNVDDKLSEEGNGYFNKALAYYEQAIELDPEFFDAIYSSGSMYFNKGAAITQVMSELGMSNEDLEKYDKLDAEVKDLFGKALPYFKKAEKMNPSDLNTLIALKEIYARMDDMEKTKEFSDRVKTVQEGGDITESFFN